MKTLLERLKTEHAATIAANQKEYPTLFASLVNDLPKYTHVIDLPILTAINLLQMTNQDDKANYFYLNIAECFIGYDEKINFDYSGISHVYCEDIDHRDAPDYCDAYISEATYFGRPMTELELEILNEHSDFVYDSVIEQIH
jgi:hypothetical protein